MLFTVTNIGVPVGDDNEDSAVVPDEKLKSIDS